MVKKKVIFRGNKVSWEEPYCFICEREFPNKASLSSHLRNSPKHQISWKRWAKLAQKNGHRIGSLDFHIWKYPIHPILSRRQLIYPPPCGFCLQCGKKLMGRQKRYCSSLCREKYHDSHNLKRIKRRTVLKQDFTCPICGNRFFEDEFELDHQRPICLGGDPWNTANHQVLCGRCHIEKTRRDMHEFRTGFRPKRLDAYLRNNGHETGEVSQHLRHSEEEVRS